MINIQNIDGNEWYTVRKLNPADHYPAIFIKADKDFGHKRHFKDIKFPVKTRDFHMSKKRILSAVMLLVMKLRKKIQSMYQ